VKIRSESAFFRLPGNVSGDDAGTAPSLMARHKSNNLPSSLLEGRSWASSVYAKKLLPLSGVSRPLQGAAPTVDVAVNYSKSNVSPILKLFPSRLDQLVAPNQQ
jgi:hypothetical protein